MILYLNFTGWICGHEFHWTGLRGQFLFVQVVPSDSVRNCGSQYIWNRTEWMWHLTLKSFPWLSANTRLPSNWFLVPKFTVSMELIFPFDLAHGWVWENHIAQECCLHPLGPYPALQLIAQHSLVIPQTAWICGTNTTFEHAEVVLTYFCSSQCSTFHGVKEFKVSVSGRIVQDQLIPEALKGP